MEDGTYSFLQDKKEKKKQADACLYQMAILNLCGSIRFWSGGTLSNSLRGTMPQMTPGYAFIAILDPTIRSGFEPSPNVAPFHWLLAPYHLLILEIFLISSFDFVNSVVTR